MYLEHRLHLYAYLAKHLQQSRGRWSGGRKAPSFPSRIYRRKSQYQTCPRCQRHEQIIKCLPSTPPAAKHEREPGMDYPDVPVARDALCGSGTPAQNRPARFRYLLPPPQNRSPAHRRDSSRCHEPYQTVSKYRLRLPLPASHSQWKPEKRRRVCRIPTCLAETEL